MPKSKSKRSKTRKNRRKNRYGNTGSSVSREKLSQRIWDFAGEFIRLGETAEDQQSLLNAACSAWNIACLPRLQRQRSIADYVEQFQQYNPEASDEEIANVRSDMEQLIANKIKLFPADERAIISARLIPAGGDQVRIEVVSARDE